MQIKNLAYIFIFLFFTGCIEEFRPEISSYDYMLVIDGAITNEPGPYVIRLSKSSEVYNPEYSPLIGANVVISDDLNSEETLLELEPGVYSTSPIGIRGEVGRKYRITINIDGATYQSVFQKLEGAGIIDSVYAEVEYQGGLEGLQFYINAHNNNDVDKRFLWRLTETYKYEADEYPLDYIYYNEDSIVSPPSEYVDLIKVCWKTNKVFEIFTGAINTSSASKSYSFSLNYVNTETEKLFEKYSLFVNQYTISEDAYRYWNEIKDQNDESGSLYTKQPFQIQGNLTDINNPDNLILGYFMVAGVAKKRIFVEQPDLNFYYDVCKASTDAYTRWKGSVNPSYPIYVKLVGGGIGKAGLACFDCRMKEGTTEKPDFWED